MKKNVIIIVLLIVTAIISTILIYEFNKKDTISDTIKFKQEYESLNGKYNKSSKRYVEISIDKENPFVYASYDEIVKILENGTGIIYFGFPECPWCRTAVPVLIDAAKELSIEKIYYFNALDIRDTKRLDQNGNIIIEKEGTEEYKKLINLMYEVLPEYDGLNDPTIKRLYFPTVVFVDNGEILSIHEDTVTSQEDPYVALSKQQYNELKSIYIDGMNKVYNILCDESC